MSETIDPAPRRGDWITTYGGGDFYPLDPRAEEVSLYDIVHASSNICRFNGHCDRFYSLAEHACLVARIVYDRTGDARQAIAGLLHDASEPYACDVVRPLKRMLPGYKEMERKIMDAIWEHVRTLVPGFPYDESNLPDVVKEADEIALACEAIVLMPLGAVARWRLAAKPDPRYPVLCLTPPEAKSLMRDTFAELARGVPPPVPGGPRHFGTAVTA